MHYHSNSMCYLSVFPTVSGMMLITSVNSGYFVMSYLFSFNIMLKIIVEPFNIIILTNTVYKNYNKGN